jgi:hypothetical protein
MKRLLTLGALAMLAGGLPAATLQPSRVTRAKLASVEAAMNRELAAMYPDNPMLVLGKARGVYLDGYGAVFTAEIILLPGPTPSPFNPTISKAVVMRHHKEKLARIPVLKATMYKILCNAAESLGIPDNEQVVVAVTLDRYSWEDPTGIPAQIVMQGERGRILADRTDRPALEAAVKLQEL